MLPLVALVAGYAVGALWLASAVALQTLQVYRSKRASRRSKRALIVFGTQTGTAARFARSLFTQVARRYDDLAWRVADADDFEPEELQGAHTAVFIMASYGDGEPPASAHALYKALGDAAGAGAGTAGLAGLAVGVFGLGKRRYPKFTGSAITLERLLGALGCAALVPRGAGDDDGNIDTDFEAWAADLIAALDAALGYTPKDDDGTASAPAPLAYDVTVVEGASRSLRRLDSGSGRTFRSPAIADVVAVTPLLPPGAGRSIIRVELGLAGSRLRYAHGDHLAVYPENPAEVVDAALRLLGQPEDLVFRLAKPEGGAGDALPDPPPGALVLRAAISKYADLMSPPSKAAVAALAACAGDPAEGAALARLASPAGADDFFAAVLKDRRGLLDVAAQFPSVRVPIGVFFGSVAPMLQPRFYSIASSPLAHPDSVHLTVAVVKEKRPEGSVYRGLCSNWLASCRVGMIAPAYVSRSTFKLPADPAAPVVMVGPGTGLAPFLGFLQERAALKAGGAALGPAVLFFGCRTSNEFICRDELAAFLEAGAITELHVALSREGAQKDYVQHHIKAQGARVWALLGPGRGSFYVCGDAKRMAKDVHAALVEVAAAHGGGGGAQGTQGGAAQGEAALEAMATEGRYLKDVY